MANRIDAKAFNGIVAHLAKVGQPKSNKDWLVKQDEKDRFNDVIAKIKNWVETGNGFYEAREALFLFETGRGNCPCPMTSKAVEKHPKERDALLEKINDFLLNVFGTAISLKKQFNPSKAWNFPKEVISLVTLVKQELKKEAEEQKHLEKMAALGVEIDYSVLEDLKDDE